MFLNNRINKEELKKQLLFKNEPVFEAVATTGEGVLETLKAIARQVLVERQLESGELSGITDNYLRVKLPGSERRVGQLVQVSLHSVEVQRGSVVVVGQAEKCQQPLG
jgi:hypothetical protein